MLKGEAGVNGCECGRRCMMTCRSVNGCECGRNVSVAESVLWRSVWLFREKPLAILVMDKFERMFVY